MQDHLALADERLAANVSTYGQMTLPYLDGYVSVPGLMAFNLDGARVVLDGIERCETALFCVLHDPAQLSLSKGAGAIVTVRLCVGGFNRLFGIQPDSANYIRRVDRALHPVMASIEDALRAADPVPRARFAALDKAFLEIAKNAKTPGLAERFYRLVFDDEADLSIVEAADRLNCTQRTLERACRKRFGRTPKRIARGLKAVRTWRREVETGERPEAMPDFKFADLPHYAREIRQISGLTRTENRHRMEVENERPSVLLWPDGRQAEGKQDIAAWNSETHAREQLLRHSPDNGLHIVGQILG